MGGKHRHAGEYEHDESGHPTSGLDAQKKPLGASERDEAARAAWSEQGRQLESRHLGFVDECSSNLALPPLHARAPRGERAVDKVPPNYGANTTLMASLSLQGMGEALVWQGATDASSFEAYIQQVLAPSLQPGQIVVMENLSSHQGEPVRKAIEARGCQLLFLPTYSPDFSPIEGAFSKLKTFLRRLGARTQERLLEAIAAGLLTITPADALGWFTHCGYLPPEAQPSL